MKKIISILATLVLTTMSINFAKAEGYAIGVTGAYSMINADGKEVEGGETTKASVSNNVFIPSIFIEKQVSDKLAIGFDWIPMNADVSSKTKTRTDTETSVTGTAAEVSTSRTQKAQAEINNHVTLYADYGEKAYVKLGVAQVNVKTKESLGTGSAYGDETILGGIVGVGVKGESDSGVYFKFEATYTDYETAKFTSSTARAGVTTNNKIDANLDRTDFKLAIGKRF